MGATNIEKVISDLEEMSRDKHVCLVYEAEDELNNVLVTYFEKGLLNGEVCIWVLSDATHKDKTREILRTRIPDIDIYIQNEQMILSGTEGVYTKGNEFDSDRVFQLLSEKVRQAIEKGFTGLRVSGSGNWARGRQWVELIKYEELINAFIQGKPIKALCTYSKKIAGLTEIISVGIQHSKAIVCQEDKWQIIDATDAPLLLAKIRSFNPD